MMPVRIFSLKVMVVPQKLVTPCEASKAAMLRMSASVPSEKSVPCAPCT